LYHYSAAGARGPSVRDVEIRTVGSFGLVGGHGGGMYSC
jgi:hypothetical protein